MVVSSRNFIYNHRNIVDKSSEHAVHLLLGQYYYGQAPKRELHELLNSIGIENKL